MFHFIHSRMSERQDVSFIGISLKLSRGSTTMYHRRSNGSPYRGFHKCHKLVSKICNTEVEQHGPPPKDKTELMIFAPKHRTKELTDFSSSRSDNIIHDTPYAKNLGAYFDRTLSMEKQCNAIARSCYFHIRNIGCIRSFTNVTNWFRKYAIQKLSNTDPHQNQWMNSGSCEW
jgi:hypothetical protein